MKRGLKIFGLVFLIGVLSIGFVNAGLLDWFKDFFGGGEVMLSPEEGLLAHYSFENNVRDVSGEGNNGVNYGVGFVEGKVGKAGSFDGIDDYVIFQKSGVMDKLRTSSWTISTWVKRDRIGKRDIIIGRGDSLSSYQDRGFEIEIDSNDEVYVFYRAKKGGPDLGVSGNVKINKEWHYITVVRDKENSRLSIYVDGVLDKAVNNPPDIEKFAVTTELIIGSWMADRFPNKGYYFEGRMDEFKIWNRALSGDEVGQEFKGKPPVSKNETSGEQTVCQKLTQDIIDFLSVNPITSCDGSRYNPVLDVNKDKVISTLDSLIVVNKINSLSSLESEGWCVERLEDDGDPCEGEGESSKKYSGYYTIPSDSIGIDSCKKENIYQELDECINQLVENKKPGDELRINILEGNYLIDNTIFIFQREGIAISGEGRDKTIIKLDNSILRKGMIDKSFIINIIDSNNIAIEGIGFDGSSLSGQRGIGICPTGDNVIDGIEIKGNSVKDLKYWFVIIGNSHPEKYLGPTSSLSEREGPQRFKEYLEQVEENQYCSGNVKNVLFKNNVLNLHAVGFYLAPYSYQKTKDRVMNPESWIEVGEDVSNKNTNYRITNNYFIASYDGELHSFMKVHSFNGMVIEGNTFDAKNFNKVFCDGAAINLGINGNNIGIKENKIIFPENHKCPAHGVGVKSYISDHQTFGYGDKKLTPPTKDVLIQENEFKNSKIRFFDCCSRDWGAEYCEDLDNNQIKGNKKYQDINLIKNKLNGNYANQELIHIVSRDEEGSWVKNCRTNLVIEYCGDGVCDEEENHKVCEEDCGEIKGPEGNLCGDGICAGIQEFNTLNNGEEMSITLQGIDYTLSAIVLSDNEVRITANGENSEELNKDRKYEFGNGLIIYVEDISYHSYVGGEQSVDFVIGEDSFLCPDDCPECIDSDGGINGYVYGEVTTSVGDQKFTNKDGCFVARYSEVTEINEKGVFSKGVNECQNPVSGINAKVGECYVSGAKNQNQPCTGPDCYVMETFCRYDENGKLIPDADADQEIKCPNGCKDGACIEVKGSSGGSGGGGGKVCSSKLICEITPTVCPSSGIQVKECTDVNSCVEDYAEEIDCSPGECSGCMLDERCYPFGYRGLGKYCSDDGEWEGQKGKEESCENNFECSTNLCIDRECIDGGLWKKFIEWLKRLFG